MTAPILETGTPIARLQATPVKRLLSVGVMVLLGVMLVYPAVAQPPQSLLLQGFLLGVGVAVLALAQATWRATARAIMLYSDRLQDSEGRIICRIEDIKSVDRATFAFKPSNGFLIHTSSPQTGHWSPGLWWQRGRRIGIGGVTPAGPAKFMAEMLAAKVDTLD